MIDFYLCSVFLFDDAAPPGICSLSLHDALPIWVRGAPGAPASSRPRALLRAGRLDDRDRARCPGGADPGAVQLAAAAADGLRSGDRGAARDRPAPAAAALPLHLARRQAPAPRPAAAGEIGRAHV